MPRNSAEMLQKQYKDLLSTRTSIPPDIPPPLYALLLTDLPDLWAGDALVLTIVPLADVLGDLDLGRVAVTSILLQVAMRFPWERVLEAKVEQLKGALGALTRRYVSGRGQEVVRF